MRVALDFLPPYAPAWRLVNASIESPTIVLLARDRRGIVDSGLLTRLEQESSDRVDVIQALAPKVATRP